MWHGGGGGGGWSSSSAAGLPFGGIPEELARRAERLTADEPDWSDVDVEFSHRVDSRPFSLRVLLAPHLWAVAVGLLLVGVETALLQAGPFLTKLGIDEGVVKRDFGVIVTAAIAYVVSVVIGGFSTWARVAWTGRLAATVSYELRVRVFAHVQRLSLDFFSEEKAGRIMTRMTSDIEAMNQMLQNGLIQMIVQGLTTVVITIVLFVMNVELALFTVVIVVPALIWLSLWFRSESAFGYQRVRDRIAEVLSDLAESLAGIRIVTAFNRQHRNVIHHREVVAGYRAANVYMAHVSGIYGPGSTALGLLAQVMILLAGGILLIRHQVTVGSLTAFVLYMTSFFAPLQQLVQLYDTYQSGQAAVLKLAGLLDARPSVPERADAYPLPPAQGEVVFDHVSFGYDPERPVLRDVNLRIAPGETFALVGPTGAGKSTIAKLIVRLHDPTSGRVLVDGHDLREVTLGSLRHQLGVVPQEPFLFAGSIRDNIAFARPEAGDDEVMEAVRAVGLDDLVERLPDGLDSPCHERGVSLSSGERQLLALARAFLARPRILVLDEATSNLDLASEAKVEVALDAMLENRSAILVAHRLSTAMRAHRIGVVDDGRLLEVGTHDELVALGGRYADMHATWMRHLTGEPAQPARR